MNPGRWLPSVGLAMLMSALGFAQGIPIGTVLPVMMNTSLDSTRSKPGDKLTGRLMQEVALGRGERIRAGARLYGQVVEAVPASANTPSRVVVRVDRLVAGQKEYSIVVSLRALASMEDVFSAQLPTGTFDEYGTSISDWTTVQVGGAAVYLGDGTVREALDSFTTEFIYVDLDLDVLDRAFAPATPGSRPGGLTPWEMRTAARVCGEFARVRVFDLVEMDPEQDIAGQTALCAAACLLSFASGVHRRCSRLLDARSL